MSTAHLAIDLGASSGRAIVGILDDQKLRLEEVHRFEHLVGSTPPGPVWDVTGIWRNILAGLKSAAVWCKENSVELKSVGVDAWGVDWALLGASGELLSLPHSYRDPQNEAACERVLDRVGGFEKLFARTGIQKMQINTLFQVAARFEKEPKLFDAVDRFIFIPDLFHYWLSGEVTTELTIASTSAMLDVNTGDWDRDLISQLGLPTDMLGPICEPGTRIGTLRKELAEATGASPDLAVIAPAAHDTGSAVAAVPATGDQSWAYVSSGTWSLLGAEIDQPNQSDAARQVPFTNERGLNGTIRFLKNLGGLWLIQELRRDLQHQGDDRDFASLVQEARQSQPGRTLVDPNYSGFVTAGNMQAKLQDFARESNQPIPETVGQLARSCLDSLALCYGYTLNQLETVLGSQIGVLHLVGGGIQNKLLNELTADAIDRPVITGPIEATAIGNVMVQAMGFGQVANLTELREVVANSFPVETFICDDGVLRNERERYAELVAQMSK